MLRASKGNTSSVEIFWLMPAMRRKERKGPGIVTVAADPDRVLGAVDDWTEVEVSDSEPEAKL